MSEIQPFECPFPGHMIAGVDEVGRGPLAGPVVAAAVILDPAKPIAGLADSKKVSERKRDALYDEIRDKALSFAVARASVEEIDKINILHASMLAMSRAVSQLMPACEYALIDGNRCPSDLVVPAVAVVKGDARVESISAASILAKVERDREMVELDEVYPGYGLAKHKGYPTKAHLEAIEMLGVTPIYRRSFGPVARLVGDVSP